MPVFLRATTTAHYRSTNPIRKLAWLILPDQQIFEQFYSSKMRLLSGKTLVSPLKHISKKMNSNHLLP